MSLVNHTDLREFSRDSDRICTQILVEDAGLNLVPWLTLGEINLQSIRGGSHMLRAPLAGGATDEEHDTAQLISIELLGLRWDSVYGGVSTFEAYIRPPHAYNPDNFRVPSEDYKMSVVFCKYCPINGRKPHLISDYLPPHNKKLHDLLSGRRIEIRTGAAPAGSSPSLSERNQVEGIPPIPETYNERFLWGSSGHCLAHVPRICSRSPVSVGSDRCDPTD